ncbi:transcriptional regulator [Lacrimispora sp. NSJ-141]|uniref:Transcriptional regulator n=1 Tax=Lientehia hominis TaxID=2897778 RepID=A0AAP2W901_9FIRM|nr:transcriptional regulator [Lientehia hominis]MCD2491154.1 transcriptional regulator [Lientehia hominis]
MDKAGIKAVPEKKLCQDLTGKRFGKLVVLEYVKPEKGMGRWKCRCDCGNITYKRTGHLNAGTAVSCGCARKNHTQDLAGRRFGRLTVLKKTEQTGDDGSVLWECQCDCGGICLISTNQLRGGTAKSCGCAWRRPTVQAGDRFGRLTAVCPTEKRSSKAVVWECLCDCGNTVEVRSTSLQNGHTVSCGCAKADIDAGRDFKKVLTYRDGTCIEFLKNIDRPTKSTSSDTGVRGVRLLRNGKYNASITFRRHRYSLGTYTKVEDAISARKQGENMVKEYLEDYKISRFSF